VGEASVSPTLARRSQTGAVTLTPPGVGYQRDLTGGFSLYMEPSLAFSRYDAVDPLFGKRRSDQVQELQIALLNRRIVLSRFTPRASPTRLLADPAASTSTNSRRTALRWALPAPFDSFSDGRALLEQDAPLTGKSDRKIECPLPGEASPALPRKQIDWSPACRRPAREAAVKPVHPEARYSRLMGADHAKAASGPKTHLAAYLIHVIN